MKGKINHNARLSLFLVIVFLFLLPASARSQDTVDSPSAKELEDLLAVIENPERRGAFIKDLRGLITAKKALDSKGRGETLGGGKDKQLLIVSWVFERFEEAIREVRSVAATTHDLIRHVPETALSIKSFLVQSENRYRMLILFIDAGVAALLALFSGLLLARPVESAVAGMRTLLSKIGWGSVYIFLKGVPYVVLGVSFPILFELMPSFPVGRTIFTLLFVLLFVYRIVMALAHIVLSPDEPHRRIISVSDENAQYLWIWTRRLAMYAFFYFMVTRSFLWSEMASPHFSLLRAGLLIPFPVMLMVFVLQVAREIRTGQKKNDSHEDREKASGKRKSQLIHALTRYWPILATGYIWAVFLTLMFQYGKGFEYLFHATIGTTVAVFVTMACLRALDQAFRRFFRINEGVSERFPNLEEKANRYMQIVRKGLTVVVVGSAFGVVGEIWGVPVSEVVASETGGAVILRAIAIILTLAIFVCITEITNALSAYLLSERRARRKKEISQKQKTLIPVVRTAVNIAAAFVAGIIILDRLGVNTTPILAGAGIVGLAVGFGSQTLVKDVINGLFILFEESIRVGDYATVGNQEGTVESVGLRTVKLRDVNGTVHVIPNSTIDSLSNYSKVFSRTVMDIGVAYREDVDEVIEILKELGEELRHDSEYGPDILEPLEVLGLDRFEDSAVIIRARFKTRPLKQWGVKREFYRRLKRVFDERGIEIPFPHQTIYMGEPKKGKAPPLRVTIDERGEGGAFP
jgi:small conductance mechanosensitive channel